MARGVVRKTASEHLLEHKARAEEHGDSYPALRKDELELAAYWATIVQAQAMESIDAKLDLLMCRWHNWDGTPAAALRVTDGDQ